MSLRWPSKDPDESLDFSVDWSRFLDTGNINSVAWFIQDTDGTYTAAVPPSTVDGLTITNQSNTDSVATAVFSAGTLNKRYNVKCQINFGAESYVASRTIILPIKEK